MKFKLIILFLSIQIVSFATTGKTYLELIKQNYEKLNFFEMDMQYQLFKGHNGIEVKKDYHGVYIKEDNRIYRRIENTEFINFKKTSVKINHDEKMMELSTSYPIKALDVDLENTLKYCKEIKLKTIGKNRMEVIMVLKDMHPFPFSQLSIEIDKKYWINKITIYYAAKTNFGTYFKPDMAYPKMEVTYGKIKKSDSGLEKLELNSYFDKKKGQLEPGTKYLGYRIIDAR